MAAVAGDAEAAAAEAAPDVPQKEEAEEKVGELLYCGTTAWDCVGRNKQAEQSSITAPTRLRPLVGVPIVYIASGSTSSHCIALDIEGRCFTWGRNEKGQLGHGDILNRNAPTIVESLSKYKVVRAGAGRQHTIVVTDDGSSYSFGFNKHGQLGTGSSKEELEVDPVKCLVSDAIHTYCGAEFTVWLTSAEGASILTAGLPQYGQLGHGSDHEYNMKEGSVKIAYEAQPRPRPIAAFSGKTVTKVACGTNHTVAVDSEGHVYTWGFGGYGRLGHKEQKDEWTPRMVETFQKSNVLPPNAVVGAGAAFSACTAGGGQLYMWGRVKAGGHNWMYPMPFLGMSGWNIRSLDCGSTTSLAAAESSCISWGTAHHGELGYGPTGPKSSANPKKIETLEDMHVISVACGLQHSLMLLSTSKSKDRLEALEVYECGIVGNGKKKSDEGGEGEGEGEEAEAEVAAKGKRKAGEIEEEGAAPAQKKGGAAAAKKKKKVDDDGGGGGGGGGDDAAVMLEEEDEEDEEEEEEEDTDEYQEEEEEEDDDESDFDEDDADDDDDEDADDDDDDDDDDDAPRRRGGGGGGGGGGGVVHGRGRGRGRGGRGRK